MTKFERARPRDGHGPARAVANLPVRRSGRDRREHLGVGVGHAVRNWLSLARAAVPDRAHDVVLRRAAA